MSGIACRFKFAAYIKFNYHIFLGKILNKSIIKCDISYPLQKLSTCNYFSVKTSIIKRLEIDIYLYKKFTS